MGCVACLDGYALQIQVPTSNETGNVKVNFSGHYQTHSINVQAAHNYKCRFVYAALAVPGGANRIAALRKTKFSQVVRKLPMGKFVIGNDVYACSETSLNPFQVLKKMNQGRMHTIFI